jgi:hypothetical protein
MSQIYDTPIEFNDLMFLALDHGFDSIEKNSGPLIPFVIHQNIAGERFLNRFFCDQLEAGIDEAKKYVSRNEADIYMYAIAWDGFITLDNKKWDAIIVETGMKNKEIGILICQRYESKGYLRKKNVKVGNPIEIGNPTSKIYQKK